MGRESPFVHFSPDATGDPNEIPFLFSFFELGGYLLGASTELPAYTCSVRNRFHDRNKRGPSSYFY